MGDKVRSWIGLLGGCGISMAHQHNVGWSLVGGQTAGIYLITVLLFHFRSCKTSSPTAGPEREGDDSRENHPNTFRLGCLCTF